MKIIQNIFSTILIVLFFSVVPYSVLASQVDIANITVTPSEAPRVGDTVTVTMTASNPEGLPIYYKFYYCANYGTSEYVTTPWTVVQDYSTSNTAQYTFNETGKYIIVVRAVTDPNNEPAALPIVGHVVDVGGTNDVTLTGLSRNPSTSVTAGETVQFTASAVTYVNDVIYYKFYYCANYGTDTYATTPWTTVQDYSTLNTCDYTFPATGDYIVVVRAVTDPNNEPAALPIVGQTVTVTSSDTPSGDSGETFTDSFDDPVFTNSNWATATDVQQTWSFPVLSGSDLGYHVSTTSKGWPAAKTVSNSTSYATAKLYIEMLLRLGSHIDAYSSENTAGLYFLASSGEMYSVSIQLDFDGPTAIDLNITRNSENLVKTPISLSFDTFYKMIAHIDSNNIMTAYLYSLDGALLGSVSTGSALSIDSGVIGIHGRPEVTFDDFSLTTDVADQVIPDIPVIWPQNRHDAQNTGYSPYAGPSTGTLKWQFLLPSTVINASPVIGADGIIYICNGQSGSGGLYAINPDGSQKWLYQGHSGDVAPAISTDGTVYTPAYLSFNAINPDGTLKWSYTAQNIFRYTSPTIGQDGTIYIGCDIDLLALSSGGTLLWQYRVGEEINSTPAVASDGTIYVRSRTEYLCAVNPDGSQKWKLKLGSNTYGSGMSPVIAADGTIYTNGISSYSYGPNYPDFEYNALYAINPDGTTKWVFNSISPAGVGPGGFGAALDSAGNIYLGGRMNEDQHTNAFFALDSSGTLLWSYPMPPTDYFGKSSPAIDVNGAIYFGATNYLYALNSNGTLKWKFPTDIDGSSPAIGSGGTLYFGSKDGYLNAIGGTQ